MTDRAQIRVLLVDDHPALREGLAAIMSQQTDLVIVAQAGDGEQAVHACRRHKPDVALVDLRLPDRSGAEVIRELRRDYPEVKFVVFSTHDTEEDVYRAFQAGAVAYVLKDRSCQEVVEILRAVHAGQRFVPARVEELLRFQKLKVELGAREREVLTLAAKGLQNREIASRMQISAETVKTHLERARDKLDAADRTAAVAKALALGLIRL